MYAKFDRDDAMLVTHIVSLVYVIIRGIFGLHSYSITTMKMISGGRLAVIFNCLLRLSHAFVAPASPLRSSHNNPSSAIKSSRSASDDASPLPSRRTFLSHQTSAAIAVISSIASPTLALAAPDNDVVNDELIDVYFGCGCFWHVQHEFVEAERKILGRADDQITSRTGYAGGKAAQSTGKFVITMHRMLPIMAS